jgi:Secretion system C-terminal sorting domain/GEVED domain
MKKITLLLAILLTAVTGSFGQCLDATSSTPLYPTATYVPAICDGVTVNSITTAGYASEYSNVEVGLGQTYTFTSSVVTDFITIGSADGLTAIVWGENGTLTWIADISGVVRFYTHLDNACGAANVSRTRGVICTPPTCPKPLNVVVGSITTNSADFTWDAGGNETEWEVVVLPNGDPAPDATTTGIAVSGSSTYQAASLNDSSAYQFYVRASCGAGDFSTWTAVKNFATSCVAVTAFTENFDAAVAFPTCWSKVGTLGSANVQASTPASSAPNVLYLYGSSGTSQGVVAMPPVSNAGTGTYRLKFKARSNFTVGGVIEVGYLTDIADAATFVSLQSFTTTSTSVFDTFIANLGTDPGANEVLAFRHLGTPAYSVLIDDVAWEPVPTILPSCASNFVATIDANCGNFATQIAWDAATDADGYNLTIGTTAGGNDILDAQNIGGATSYSYTGTFNTTYYYKVVPFNIVGSATGCTEESFTTFSSGCYCTSLPTSNDGSGITNVQIGSTDFPNGDVTYFDNTAEPVELAQGINNNVQISFATGFTYDTNIWIDLDDNLTFDDTELVFSGTSTNTNPTIFDSSFVVPADATLGNHRMRIGSADAGQATPNACYSGSYGVTLDYTVKIIVASCTPAAATTQAVTDCVNNNFTVDVDVTNLGSGTPSITDGTTVWPVTALGIVNVGPFSFGTPVTLTLNHGVETICNVNLGTINLTGCPPANDNLCHAMMLTVGSDSAGDAFSLASSTAETGEPAGACFNSGVNGSVWFSFVAPASGEVTMSTDIAGGTLTDSEIAIYAGIGVTCTDLSTLGAALNCDQDSGTVVTYNSILSVTALTPGDTYYIQVDRWGTATPGTFGLTVVDSNPLSSNSFSNKNFTYYPNPVKDVLNLSYTKNISNVTVFNLLGQQMSSKTVNANQSKVDMSNLAAGTYLVKVTADNQVKTIKVIKN